LILTACLRQNLAHPEEDAWQYLSHGESTIIEDLRINHQIIDMTMNVAKALDFLQLEFFLRCHQGAPQSRIQQRLMRGLSSWNLGSSARETHFDKRFESRISRLKSGAQPLISQVSRLRISLQARQLDTMGQFPRNSTKPLQM